MAKILSHRSCLVMRTKHVALSKNHSQVCLPCSLLYLIFGEEAAGHAGPDAPQDTFRTMLFDRRVRYKPDKQRLVVWYSSHGTKTTKLTLFYPICLPLLEKQKTPLSSPSPKKQETHPHGRQSNPPAYLAVFDLARDVGLQTQPAERVATGRENEPRPRRPIVQANLPRKRGAGRGSLRVYGSRTIGRGNCPVNSQPPFEKNKTTMEAHLVTTPQKEAQKLVRATG